MTPLYSSHIRLKNFERKSAEENSRNEDVRIYYYLHASSFLAFLDSFIAALMYALVNSWDDADAIVLANAVGSVMASKMGTGTKCPTFDEVVEILEMSGYTVSNNSKEEKRFLPFSVKI